MEKPKNNPLVEPWNTPFNTPPFEEIKRVGIQIFCWLVAAEQDAISKMDVFQTLPLTGEDLVVGGVHSNDAEVA